MLKINIYKYKIKLKTIKIKYLIKKSRKEILKNQSEKSIDLNKNTID